MPPLLKMEAPDKAFGGVIARCDACFDGDRAVAPALCGGRAVRESMFLSIFVEIPRLDAGDIRRNDHRVECDGAAEARAASNSQFTQKLGAEPLLARAERALLGREAPDRFGGVDFPTVRATSLFYAASARRIA